MAETSRSTPLKSSTRSWGAKRSASRSQLKTSDLGTITSDVPAPAARRASSSASTCTVLPSPMSSARQPPNSKRRRKSNQPSASAWYGRSVPRKPAGTSAAAIRWNDASSPRTRCSASSVSTSGSAASSTSSNASCDRRKRIAPSTRVPVAKSTPMRSSASTGTKPITPSPSCTSPPCRSRASSTVVNGTSTSPYCTLPERSNQSTPERTCARIPPAVLYETPSASTRHPSPTSRRTSGTSCAAAMVRMWPRLP